MDFDIEQLRVSDTAPVVLQSLKLAQDWLLWHENNTEDVLRRSADSWEIRRPLAGTSFGFAARNPILLFAYDKDIQSRAHPLLSPMSWFAGIPWEVRKTEGSSMIRFVFQGLKYNEDIEFPRLSIRMTGYSNVLSIIDAVSRARERGESVHVRCAVGDGQVFPFLGWTLAK